MTMFQYILREFEDAMRYQAQQPTNLPAFMAGTDYTWIAFDTRRRIGQGNLRTANLTMVDRADMMLHFAANDRLWGKSARDRIDRAAMACAGRDILKALADAPSHSPLLEMLETTR